MDLQKMNKELLEEVNYLKNQNILLYHKNMTFNKLNKRLITTSTEKGIFKNSSAYNQALYTQSELDELKQSLTAYENGLEYYTNSKGEKVNTIAQIMDDYGDVLNTIFNGMAFFKDKFTPLEAFEHSLVIFENRTGETINGKFVKDE